MCSEKYYIDTTGGLDRNTIGEYRGRKNVFSEGKRQHLGHMIQGCLVSLSSCLWSLHCGPSPVLELTKWPSGFRLPVIEEQQDNLYQVKSLSGCTFFFFPFLLHHTWDLGSLINDTPKPFALGARCPSILDHQGNLWICFVSAYHGPAYPYETSLTAHEITFKHFP